MPKCGVFSGPYFPAFRLNTVFSPNAGKYRPKINSVSDTFHAVIITTDDQYKLVNYQTYYVYLQKKYFCFSLFNEPSCQHLCFNIEFMIPGSWLGFYFLNVHLMKFLPTVKEAKWDIENIYYHLFLFALFV